MGDLITVAQSAELLVISRDDRSVRHRFRESPSDRVIDAIERPALAVHAHESARPGLVGRIVERLVF